MKLREQSKRTKEAIIAELQKHGATNVEVVMKNRHPAVQFRVDGLTGFITFTGTRTDHRALHN